MLGGIFSGTRSKVVPSAGNVEPRDRGSDFLLQAKDRSRINLITESSLAHAKSDEKAFFFFKQLEDLDAPDRIKIKEAVHEFIESERHDKIPEILITSKKIDSEKLYYQRCFRAIFIHLKDYAKIPGNSADKPWLKEQFKFPGDEKIPSPKKDSPKRTPAEAPRPNYEIYDFSNPDNIEQFLSDFSKKSERAFDKKNIELFKNKVTTGEETENIKTFIEHLNDLEKQTVQKLIKQSRSDIIEIIKCYINKDTSNDFDTVITISGLINDYFFDDMFLLNAFFDKIKKITPDKHVLPSPQTNILDATSSSLNFGLDLQEETNSKIDSLHELFMGIISKPEISIEKKKSYLDNWLKDMISEPHLKVRSQTALMIFSSVLCFLFDNAKDDGERQKLKELVVLFSNLMKKEIRSGANNIAIVTSPQAFINMLSILQKFDLGKEVEAVYDNIHLAILNSEELQKDHTLMLRYAEVLCHPESKCHGRQDVAIRLFNSKMGDEGSLEILKLISKNIVLSKNQKNISELIRAIIAKANEISRDSDFPNHFAILIKFFHTSLTETNQINLQWTKFFEPIRGSINASLDTTSLTETEQIEVILHKITLERDLTPEQLAELFGFMDQFIQSIKQGNGTTYQGIEFQSILSAISELKMNFDGGFLTICKDIFDLIQSGKIDLALSADFLRNICSNGNNPERYSNCLDFIFEVRQFLNEKRTGKIKEYEILCLHADLLIQSIEIFIAEKSLNNELDKDKKNDFSERIKNGLVFSIDAKQKFIASCTINGASKEVHENILAGILSGHVELKHESTENYILNLIPKNDEISAIDLNLFHSLSVFLENQIPSQEEGFEVVESEHDKTVKDIFEKVNVFIVEQENLTVESLFDNHDRIVSFSQYILDGKIKSESAIFNFAKLLSKKDNISIKAYQNFILAIKNGIVKEEISILNFAFSFDDNNRMTKPNLKLVQEFIEVFKELDLKNKEIFDETLESSFKLEFVLASKEIDMAEQCVCPKEADKTEFYRTKSAEINLFSELILNGEISSPDAIKIFIKVLDDAPNFKQVEQAYLNVIEISKGKEGFIELLVNSFLKRGFKLEIYFAVQKLMSVLGEDLYEKVAKSILKERINKSFELDQDPISIENFVRDILDGKITGKTAIQSFVKKLDSENLNGIGLEKKIEIMTCLVSKLESASQEYPTVLEKSKKILDKMQEKQKLNHMRSFLDPAATNPDVLLRFSSDLISQDAVLLSKDMVKMFEAALNRRTDLNIQSYLNFSIFLNAQFRHDIVDFNVLFKFQESFSRDKLQRNCINVQETQLLLETLKNYRAVLVKANFDQRFSDEEKESLNETCGSIESKISHIETILDDLKILDACSSRVESLVFFSTKIKEVHAPISDHVGKFLDAFAGEIGMQKQAQKAYSNFVDTIVAGTVSKLSLIARFVDLICAERIRANFDLNALRETLSTLFSHLQGQHEVGVQPLRLQITTAIEAIDLELQRRSIEDKRQKDEQEARDEAERAAASKEYETFLLSASGNLGELNAYAVALSSSSEVDKEKISDFVQILNASKHPLTELKPAYSCFLPYMQGSLDQEDKIQFQKILINMIEFKKVGDCKDLEILSLFVSFCEHYFTKILVCKEDDHTLNPLDNGILIALTQIQTKIQQLLS